ASPSASWSSTPGSGLPKVPRPRSSRTRPWRRPTLASRIVVRDVDAGYGAVRVLHGVSIEVREGETVALLGTNGNGKSTLIKCIMGMVTPEAGEIVLETDGARIDLTRKSTGEIVGLGIALVPEGRRLFPKLSVEENLLLGAYRPEARADIRANLDFSLEAFAVLPQRRRQRARR